jgi:hypothetical protein
MSDVALRPSRPWPADEAQWARDCFHAGDTFLEIAEAANRPVGDVVQLLGSGANITARQREVLSLYSAGIGFQAIARELKPKADARTLFNEARAAAMAITALRRKGIPVPHLRDSKDAPHG